MSAAARVIPELSPEVLVLGAISYCASKTSALGDKYDDALMQLNRVMTYLESPWVYAKRMWTKQMEGQEPIVLCREDGAWYVVRPQVERAAFITGPYKSREEAEGWKYCSLLLAE